VVDATRPLAREEVIAMTGTKKVLIRIRKITRIEGMMGQGWN
jgi:hypothetical protein